MTAHLRVSTDDLAGLPEAYAQKLIQAGVRTTCVRYNGILHDFMMLNAPRNRRGHCRGGARDPHLAKGGRNQRLTLGSHALTLDRRQARPRRRGRARIEAPFAS
jgi:acetyl esterase/lipase